MKRFRIVLFGRGLFRRGLFVIVFLAFFLGACIKSPQVKHMIDVHECEARLSDIAIPIKRVPIRKLLSEYSYGYTTTESVEWLIDFYQREMERLGWELKGKVAEQDYPEQDYPENEVTLVFNKPHKLTVVSIRRNRRKKSVYIAIIQKK